MKKTLILHTLLLVLYGLCAKAQLTFTAPSQVCPFVAYTLTAEHGTLSSSGYTWSTNPAGTAISHSMLVNTLILFPNTPGVYTISVIAALDNGTMQATQQVTVNPTPTIVISPSTPTVCEGATAVLTASGAAQYTWMPGGAQGSVNIASAGIYTVSGSSLGCRGTQTVGVTEIICNDVPARGDEELKAFTDQATQILYISCGTDLLFKAFLFDLCGNIVWSGNWQCDPQKPFQISLAELNPGLYYLRLQTSDNAGTAKTLKVLKQ